MRALNKKVVTGVVAGTLVLAGSGVAYAYWTATGSGTGSATTAAGGSNLFLAQTSTISNLHPGGAAQAITGRVTNKADNAAYVTSVTVTIVGVALAPGATGCDKTDYVIANSIMNVGKDLAGKGGVAEFSGASIQFNNKETSQDACKGASVLLNYTAA
jgi:hypothetical protein